MELKPGYKQTEVGIIPEDWEVRPLKGNVHITHGFAFSSQYFANYGEFRLTTPGHFYEYGGFRDIGDKQKFYIGPVPHDYILHSGDLIVAMTEQADGLLGSAAFIPGEVGYLHNQRLGRVTTRSCNLGYLFLIFNSGRYRAKVKETAVGTKVKHTSPERLLEICVPIPPLPEQRAIAEALGDVDALLLGLDRLIAKKRDLKQAAMQQLLTGQTRLPGFTGEWEVKRFRQLAILRGNRVMPRGNQNHKLCIELEHIEPETGKLLGMVEMSESASLKSAFFPGDILFGKLRAYLRKYWLSDSSGLCSTELWVLAPNTALVTGGFLFQIVKNGQFIEAASNSYGTHMPRSDWNIVKNISINVPPMAEQTAIADVLSDMDAEILALEKRRDKTRLLKQGMMQELLTGRTRLV